jgi:hypothetical protein
MLDRPDDDSSAPAQGSRVRTSHGEPAIFGVTEGLAVYLNGTDLPDEGYANSDVNGLIAAVLNRLGVEGHMHSYWEGPQETALYLYGPSAARMSELIADVLARFPLAERCRVVPLSLTLPPPR